MDTMLLRTVRVIPRASLIGLVMVMVACDSDGPTDAGDPALGARFSDLEELANAGSRWVEIRLTADALVARKVEVEADSDSDDEEEIEGRVVSLEVSGDAGAFVLEPGDVRVQFDGTTRFRFDEDDGGDVGMEVFIAHVQQRLDAGDQPVIDAERDAPAEPQAPDDPGFLARRIDLDDDDDDDDARRGTKLEMLIDADNLISNETPPPDGWVRVLGLDIEVRLDGTTDLEIDDDDRDEDGEIEFEGFVETVDTEDSTVTLFTGRVVRIVAGTRFDDDDDGEGLRSLDQVAEALGFGLRIEAEGEGDADPDNPGVVIADELELEVEDDREFDFEGRVASVDVDAETVTLGGGMVIRIASFTEWDDDDGLRTLDAVADALARGVAIEVDGDAVALDDGTLLATEIEFERDDD